MKIPLKKFIYAVIFLTLIICNSAFAVLLEVSVKELMTEAIMGNQLAVKTLMDEANNGNPFAQESMGSLYSMGLGVVKDDTQSIFWYHKAAENGNATAERKLGTNYQFGLSVPKDTAQAIKWYQKAAEHGDVDTQYLLGGFIPKWH